MAIIVTPSGLRQIEEDTPEGWHTSYNANIDILNSVNMVGGFAVRPRDVSPTTFLPTSRYITIAGGLLKTASGVLVIGAFPAQVAPASTTAYLWLDPSGMLYLGSALPTTYAYAPLASVVCDATHITTLVDLRNPMGTVGGPLAMVRVPVTANYTQAPGVNYMRADVTGGDFTITLGPPASHRNSLLIIRRIDASANVLTIASASMINGLASVTMTGPGTMMLTSDGSTYEIIL